MPFFENLKNILLSSEVVTFITAIFVAAVTWLLNERSKRRHNDYIRKEERYLALISNLRGFYTQTKDKEQKFEFLDQINQCWLYCPDSVIQKGYAFLETVHTSQELSDTAKEKSVGELVVEIRKDLMPRKFGILKQTNLKSDDFKHLTVN